MPPSAGDRGTATAGDRRAHGFAWCHGGSASHPDGKHQAKIMPRGAGGQAPLQPASAVFLEDRSDGRGECYPPDPVRFRLARRLPRHGCTGPSATRRSNQLLSRCPFTVGPESHRRVSPAQRNRERMEEAPIYYEEVGPLPFCPTLCATFA